MSYFSGFLTLHYILLVEAFIQSDLQLEDTLKIQHIEESSMS